MKEELDKSIFLCCNSFSGQSLASSLLLPCDWRGAGIARLRDHHLLLHLNWLFSQAQALPYEVN
jgi:hypothetical protein